MAKQKRSNQETQTPLEDANENSILFLSSQMLTPKCNNPRKCRKRKPIPTFIDLEKMFENNDKSDQSSDCVIFEDKQILINESKTAGNIFISLSSSPQGRSKRNYMPCNEKEQSYQGDLMFNTAESKERNTPRTVSNDDTIDVNKLVTYDYLPVSQLSRNQQRSFSPLPSTSRDDVTFLKNDKRFKKSTLFHSAQNAEEIIEIPIDIEGKNKVEDNIQNSKNSRNSNLQNTNGNVQNNSNIITGSIDLTNNCENIDLTHTESENPLTCGASQPSQFQIIWDREYYIHNKRRQPQSTLDIPRTTSSSRTDHCSRINRCRHTSRSNSDILISASLVRAAYHYLKYRNRQIHSTSHIPRNTSSRIDDNNINNRNNEQNNVRPSTLNEFKKRYKINKNSSDVIEVQSISEKGKKNIGDCPICLENLSSKSIASTLCGHVFCMQCLKTAIRSKKKCPTCRKVLKGVGYHELFL